MNAQCLVPAGARNRAVRHTGLSLGHWGNGISTHHFLPVLCMDNSPLGLFSCVVYVKAEFGLKIPQVRFKGMLMLKTGGMPMVCKRDRRRVIARDHWRSRPGFQAWLHSHCPLGQFPQSLSASFPHQAGDGSPTPPCHQGPLTLYTCTHRSCARIQRENWGTPLPNGREMLPVPSGEVTQGEDAKQTAFIWALLMPQAGAPLWNVPQREWQELSWKNTPASSLFGWNNWGAFYTGSQRSLGEPNPLPSPWTFPVLTPFPPMCHLPTPHSPLFVGIDSQINNLHSRSCLRVHLGGKPT